MASRFSDVTPAPPDAVFGIVADFKADPSPNKVNLVVGAYRDENGKPWLLPSVSEAELRIANAKLDKEYLPIDGLAELREAAPKVVLGEESAAVKEGRVMAIQSLSGTGALRLVGNLYAKVGLTGTVYISDPTWANHRGIFESCGFAVKTYRYWNAAERNLDFAGMAADFGAMPEGSIVVLHQCAHNPTGVDMTEEQWKEIAAVIKARKLVTVFDNAYQGYCSGDLDADAWAARYFESQGIEFAVTISYSKNLGLYGERAGCLMYVCNDVASAKALLSHAKSAARVMYSNPPKHGARIVAAILNDAELYAKWKGEMKHMSARIAEMRTLLRAELERLGTPGTWNHITDQKGMFSYTGVSKAAVEHIVKNAHVYMLGSGRISMAGVTKHNVEYVAKAFCDAIKAVEGRKGKL